MVIKNLGESIILIQKQIYVFLSINHDNPSNFASIIILEIILDKPYDETNRNLDNRLISLALQK